MIKSLKLTNFLSFGACSEAVELGNLNILIGSNGSGKSNFLSAFDVLKYVPSQIITPFRETGGAQEWIWKGENGTPDAAMIDVTLETSGVNMVISSPLSLRYELGFSTLGLDIPRFVIVDEKIQNIDNNVFINAYNYKEESEFEQQRIKMNASILSQRRGPQYLEISALADFFSAIELYREWTFGPYAPCRAFQRADLSTVRLESNLINLAHVLHKLWQEPNIKQRFQDALHAVYPGIDDFGVDLAGGALQIYFREGRSKIPATHLSDGTLHYLALLAILCDPNPPPLICIEEPELGMHPDVLPTISDLLRETSERTQIIITTHSEMLVDTFTDIPEAVVVCEKEENGSMLRRLDREELKPWLENYRLGDLWIRGHVGADRW